MSAETYEPFVVPDEADLVAFFGVEASERVPADGFWTYEVVDSRGVQLRISFDVFERSVQTAFSTNGVPIATVVHEGAVRMTIEGSILTIHFRYAGAKTKLSIRLNGNIQAEWSSLQTK